MVEGLLIAAALLVAFSNGANDNFKGFATVWGSATLPYRQALLLATLATVAGSGASLWLADGLVQEFSGKGLVPETVIEAQAPSFMLGVAGGAALTVLLATRLGLPISTTHALLGGLIGAGLGQHGSGVMWAPLASIFLAPLLLSPVFAAALSLMTRRLLESWLFGQDCACLVASAETLPSRPDGTLVRRAVFSEVVVASHAACAPLNPSIKISVSRTLKSLHIVSALAICFARSVNDTPKLVALLMVSQVVGTPVSIGVIAGAMAFGGLLFSRKVAQTLSQRLTFLGHREGLAANVVTALLVLFASKLGLPVSTTHVAVGAIAGMGARTQSLNRGILLNILLSWAATLPLAAAVAYGVTCLA
jgi:inorganic phosphate transporter, PiT family